MSGNTFNLDAGALCLDFANTVDWHASDQPVDRLSDMSDLVRWAEAAGLLTADDGQKLRGRAEREPEQAAFAFRRAIALREAIYRLFASQAEEVPIDQADLALLNEALGEAQAHRRLVVAEEGFIWAWMEDRRSWARVIWSVSHSAAELLTSDRLERVRQCADDRGCGYLFVDTTRNRSRRWCSMATCGNRAKARRHYQRATADD